MPEYLLIMDDRTSVKVWCESASDAEKTLTNEQSEHLIDISRQVDPKLGQPRSLGKVRSKRKERVKEGAKNERSVRGRGACRCNLMDDYAGRNLQGDS